MKNIFINISTYLFLMQRIILLIFFIYAFFYCNTSSELAQDYFTQNGISDSTNISQYPFFRNGIVGCYAGRPMDVANHPDLPDRIQNGIQIQSDGTIREWRTDSDAIRWQATQGRFIVEQVSVTTNNFSSVILGRQYSFIRFRAVARTEGNSLRHFLSTFEFDYYGASERPEFRWTNYNNSVSFIPRRNMLRIAKIRCRTDLPG